MVASANYRPEAGVWMKAVFLAEAQRRRENTKNISLSFWAKPKDEIIIVVFLCVFAPSRENSFSF
jgi:hypothetical protein